MSVRYIQITEADHNADAFHTLGGAGFRNVRETRENWKSIPEHPREEDAPFTYVADLLDADGQTIVEDKTISAATAARLLGRPLEEARREAVVEQEQAVARAAKITTDAGANAPGGPRNTPTSR